MARKSSDASDYVTLVGELKARIQSAQVSAAQGSIELILL
jgi:hypothetical protein